VDDRLTVPNLLTLSRVAMAVAAAGLAAASRAADVAVALLVAAALLDAFDGWYARTFAQSSNLGKHLDPFADKVLVAVIFAWIGADADSTLVWVAVAVAIAREVAMTLLRSYSLRRRGRFIPANSLGRLKMFLQCASGLSILGATHWLGRPVPVPVVFGALVLAAGVSYASAMVYVRQWKRDVAGASAVRGQATLENVERVASGG
jgi:CDP-diacylglycerol--glycerol-3-phosphate 3-phosphatidyltransferase